jgi:mannose-1-phosphate guanylyltransferase
VKAMILAAGKGTRVRPITDVVPKPMIPLVGRPLMESILEHLAVHGVDQVVVNTSYLAPSIEQYFRNGARLGLQIAYSFEGKLVNGELQGQALGSAGGLKRIQDFSGFFDSTFLVLCGDALVDVDFGAVIQFHRSRNAIATIVLKEVPAEEVSKYGVVQVATDGRIVRFQEKPTTREAVSNLANTGIYVFEPEVLDYVPSGTTFDIGGQLFPELASRGLGLYGINVPFHWVDVGSVSDYWDATRLALSGQIKGYRLPGREWRPGVHLGINIGGAVDQARIEGPVCIGSSTYIGAGATIIGPAEIGASCVIEPGAYVSECILGDYTRVSSVARLERKIVLGTKCIDPSGDYIDIDETQIGWVVDDARKEWSLSEEEAVLFEVAQEIAAAERAGEGPELISPPEPHLAPRRS